VRAKQSLFKLNVRDKKMRH